MTRVGIENALQLVILILQISSSTTLLFKSLGSVECLFFFWKEMTSFIQQGYIEVTVKTFILHCYQKNSISN